jgi:hypothetical protein
MIPISMGSFGSSGRVIGPDKPKDAAEELMLEVLEYLKPTFSIVRDDMHKYATFRIHFSTDIHILDPYSSGVIATFTVYQDAVECCYGEESKKLLKGNKKTKKVTPETIVKWFFKASQGEKKKGGGGNRHPLLKRWVRDDQTITPEELAPEKPPEKKDVAMEKLLGKRRLII